MENWKTRFVTTPELDLTAPPTSRSPVANHLENVGQTISETGKFTFGLENKQKLFNDRKHTRECK